MNLIEQIKSASGREIELLVFGLAGAFSPGVMAIWYFSPEFFASATTPKLLVAACAITAPIIAINTILAIFRPFGVFKRLQSHDDLMGIGFTFGAVITGGIMFLCLVIAFLASLHLRSALYLLLGIQSAVAVLFRVRGTPLLPPESESK